MSELAQRLKTFDRARLERLSDGVAVAFVVSLPWSTSITSILAVVWLIVAIPTFDLASVRRVLLTPAGGLPVLLWLAGFVGMLWAVGVPMAERLGGLTSLHKLLFIPLLMVQFRRSERAAWMMNGFLASCSVMLVLSWAIFTIPNFPWAWQGHGGRIGIPVKDYIVQSAEFVVCVLLLAAIALEAWRQGRRWFAVGSSLLALVFLANIFYVTTSRTSLVVIPVLLLLFAAKKLPWRATLGFLMAAVVLAGLTWVFAPEVRSNIIQLVGEVQTFQPEGGRTRAGERLEFWRKSIGFIADAPLVGHGTGSIPDQFRRTIVGHSGMAGLASVNPHNQTFTVAVQLGLLGAAVLFAMWMAHVLAFRGDGLVAWAGLVIVTQNIVGSLFNSHLSDFTQGWGYVIGVGVAAGTLLKGDAATLAAPDPRLRLSG